MKKYFLISVLALASCAGNSDKKTDTTAVAGGDTSAGSAAAPSQDRDQCFVLTEGTAGQDTTAVHLVIAGDKVTGELKWLPKEKDSRKGTLTGTVNGNEVKAVWSFMQEGVKDSINVAFKLSAQELAQKPLKAGADGRQVTDDSKGYTLIYKPGNCETPGAVAN
ncbi:MAG: hypothetical protein EOO88_60045 [Pedobacter sp.]|nr:MAG: hypothetical protein EOO88_60045 [Pedobacter sp.]